jgi:hypothetical protein
MHAWRTRPEFEGEPAGAWSRWREFTVTTQTPHVRECRMGAAWIEDALAWAEGENIPVQEALDQMAHQVAIGKVLDPIQELFPKQYAGGAMDSERRTGWVAFRGTVPAKAQRLIDDYRAGGGSLEVRAHRGYNVTEIGDRMATAQYAVLKVPGVAHSSSAVDADTGAFDFFVDKAKSVRLSDRAFRAKLLDAIRTVLDQRVVRWTKGSRASADLQPVRIHISR